jgi:hypothetical protein
VTLFPSGLNCSDADANCILAYVQDLDDWVLGAILGRINKGKKNMIRQYLPIIFADPNTPDAPATEEGLIGAIASRPDYMTMPDQRLEVQRRAVAAQDTPS